MIRYIQAIVFIFCINIYNNLFSFIHPVNNATSWIRIVKFEYDHVPAATEYDIYIVNEKTCTLHEKLSSSTLTATNQVYLDWDTPYSWFVIARNGNHKIDNSDLHFLKICDLLTTQASFKKEVIDSAKGNAFSKGYVLIDGLRGIIDQQGDLVAFLPLQSHDRLNIEEYITNMKFLHSGHFAMLRHNGFELSIMSFFGDTLYHKVGMQYDMEQGKLFSAFHHGINDDEDGNIYVPTLYTPLAFGKMLNLLIGLKAKSMLLQTILYRKPQWQLEDNTAMKLDILPSIACINIRKNSFQNHDIFHFIKNKVPADVYKPDIAMMLNGGYGHHNSLDYKNQKLLIGFKEMSTLLEVKLDKDSLTLNKLIFGHENEDVLYHHHSIMYIDDSTVVYFSNEISSLGKGTSGIRIARISQHKIELLEDIPLQNITPFKYSKRSDGISILPDQKLFVSLGENPYCFVYDLKSKKNIWSLKYENYLTKDTRSLKLLTQSMYNQYIQHLYPCFFSYFINNQEVTIYNEGDEDNKTILVIEDETQKLEKILAIPKSMKATFTIPSNFEVKKCHVYLKDYYTGKIKENIK